MSRSRLFLSLALLSVLLLSFAGIAQAQTTSDSGNVIIGVRDVLESGKSVSDEFTGDATAYLYAFSGSKGDTVTVSMNQKSDSTLDPFVVLLGPKGEMLASDDDSGTDVSLSALISSKELPDDGTYLVLATTFAHIDEILVENGSETAEPTDQTFDLTVTGNTPAADLSADKSLIDIITINKGDTLDGDSTEATPVGYYVYTGKAGDVISITTEADTSSDPSIDTILHVFDPEGDRIAVDDDDPEGGTTNSAIRDFTLPEDGTYMIFATDVFFYNAGIKDSSLVFNGGKYTISVS
jgi:hypothetical protein